MAAFPYFIAFVLISILLLYGRLGKKYDNRIRENIGNTYKSTSYKIERNNNNYRYDSGNSNEADLTNAGLQNNHHTACSSLGRKYDNRTEENIRNIYENSDYTTEKNNNNYHFNSGNSHPADPTTTKDVGRGCTNSGHQNNYHSRDKRYIVERQGYSNSENSGSSNYMACFKKFIGFFPLKRLAVQVFLTRTPPEFLTTSNADKSLPPVYRPSFSLSQKIGKTD